LAIHFFRSYPPSKLYFRGLTTRRFYTYEEPKVSKLRKPCNFPDGRRIAWCRPNSNHHWRASKGLNPTCRAPNISNATLEISDMQCKCYNVNVFANSTKENANNHPGDQSSPILLMPDRPMRPDCVDSISVGPTLPTAPRKSRPPNLLMCSSRIFSATATVVCIDSLCSPAPLSPNLSLRFSPASTNALILFSLRPRHPQGRAVGGDGRVRPAALASG
jgi:hypothetical protein